MMNNIIYIIIFYFFIYIYYTKNFKIPIYIIKIYKNNLFKIFFLFTLLFFGNKNIPLTLALAINWVGLNQKIQEQELLHLLI